MRSKNMNEESDKQLDKDLITVNEEKHVDDPFMMNQRKMLKCQNLLNVINMIGR